MQAALELTNEIRLAAAVKWYELGKISQEKAAQLAGLSRDEFIFSLVGFTVSPFQEAKKEILNALTDPKYESHMQYLPFV